MYQPATVLHSHVHCQMAPLSNTVQSFRTVRITEGAVIGNAEVEHDCSSGNKSEEDSSPVYLPKGAMLQEMSYSQKTNKIPVILPHREYPRHLVPYETLCQKCVGTVT